MRTTIDRAGRVVVAKALRHGLGLEPGVALEIAEQDGRLVIAPAPPPMWLERRGGVLVAVPERRLPALTADQVRDTLEAARAALVGRPGPGPGRAQANVTSASSGKIGRRTRRYGSFAKLLVAQPSPSTTTTSATIPA